MARPARVAVAAVLLWLVAGAVGLVGLAWTFVSNCCGSSDPADSTPMLVGIVVGAVYVVAGMCLWTGGPNRLVVAALTGVLPIVHGIVAAGSVDAAAMFLPVVGLWLGLCALLRSAPVARWFESCSPTPTSG